MLISDSTYRIICPSNKIVPHRTTTLTTAGKEKLDIIGECKYPIVLTFYSPDPKEKRQMKYSVRPCVVRDLNLPAIFSYQDMKKINASLNFKKDIFEIHPTDQETLQIPTCTLPRSNLRVSTLDKVKLKPAHEALIPVKLPHSKYTYGDMLLEGCEEFMCNSGVMVCASINSPNDNGVCFVRAWNPTDHMITLKKNTVIAYANQFSEVPSEDSLACLAVNVKNSSSSKNTGALALEKEKVPTTAAELFQRIYNDLCFDVNTELNEEQKKRAVKVFMRNRSALSLAPHELGLVKDIFFEIDTGDAKPVRSKSRALPPNLMDALRAQIRRWFSQKLARWDNTSPWGAALVPVVKRGLGYRFAADLTGLNAVTKVQHKPVQNLQDRLARLQRPSANPDRLYCCIDLAEAFSCVRIKPSDIPKTAVVTPLGQLTFSRMTFGYQGSPSCFAKVIDKLENTLMEKNPSVAKSVLAYFDDLIVQGENFDDLMNKLDVLLQVLSEIGLKCQPKKCKIQKRVRWLGNVIENGTIQPDDELVRVMREWTSPTTARELASLLGALGYMRRFIRNYSSKVYHMSELKKQAGPITKHGPSKKIVWTPACENELRSVLDELCKPPILSPPNFEPNALPFCLSVDSSSRGVGCILEQPMEEEDENGNKKVVTRIIAYGSHRLNDQMKHWSSFKLELHGICKAIHNFRYFLLGKKFFVKSDHKALLWCKNLKKSSNAPSIVFRWQKLLADYDFEIIHVPATQMRLCDSLSRRKFADGDDGNLREIIPRRCSIWGLEEFDLETAQTTEDDTFWSGVMSKRFNKPALVNVVTRSRSKQQPAVHGDDDDEGSVVVSSRDRTISCRPMPEGDGDLSDSDRPPPAKFLTTDETWSSISDNFGHKSMRQDDIEVSHTAPVSWWLMEMISHLSKNDVPISTLINFCRKVQNWPTNASEVKSCVTKVLGPIIQEAKTNYDQELLFQQKALNYYLTGRLNDDFSFKMKHFGNSEVLMMVRKVDDTTRELLLIPEKLRLQMVQTIHHCDGTWHLGAFRTMVACQNFFFFYDMRTYINRYVSKCRQCVDGKRLKNTRGPGMGQTASFSKPRLRHFSIDCISYPKGNYGYCQILSIIDMSSLWPEIFLMKNTTTASISRILENEIWPRYGEGLTFVCDKASGFMAKKLKKLAEIYKSRLYYTTSYHSNSNLVEMLNAQINSLVRMKLIDQGLPITSWPSVISQVLMTLRFSQDSQSNTSAFQRIYGFAPLTEANSYFGVPSHNLEVDEETLKSRDRQISHEIFPSDKEESLPNSVLHEDDDKIILCNDGTQRELMKIPIGEKKTYFAEVSYVCESNVNQEMAQSLRDKMSEKRHLQNKALYDKKYQPKMFVPIVHEIVDWKSVFDEDSPNNRKLANYWRPGFLVLEVHAHGKTAVIQKLDLSNFTIDRSSKPRKVYVGSLRPTLMLAFLQRPKGMNAKPEWPQQQTD